MRRRDRRARAQGDGARRRARGPRRDPRHGRPVRDDQLVARVTPENVATRRLTRLNFARLRIAVDTSRTPRPVIARTAAGPEPHSAPVLRSERVPRPDEPASSSPRRLGSPAGWMRLATADASATGAPRAPQCANQTFYQDLASSRNPARMH